MQFNHLHCHTQFSLLDGAADIGKMLRKAKADNMRACAITDHGNMFGVFDFVAQANKIGIKPIVGCEFYLVEDRNKKQFTREEKDVRYHQLMLAKNAEGYKNLIKMCSLGYTEGMYGKYPRIDKQLVEKYHHGLIATTCCLGAEVPRTILRKGEEEAEKIFKWWLDLFGEDYYIELQRHDIPDQAIVNEVLLKFAKKYNVKIIASNDSHYVEQDDYNAHDILLCINTGEKQSTPSFKDFDDEGSIKGKRFAFYNDQLYFKNTQEMSAVFHDLPEAIDNTNEIADKVEELKLKKDILLPNFPVPPEFASQDDYLEHLTFAGARKRYKDLTPEIEERIRFELFTVKTMGFAGYFLIVMDFIRAGRELGVLVGPGRGSAAGSVVAYCIEITNIDPIKYDLLFERFLNPDRKSMPDIDTDFDDAGREKVIKYVVEKYGRNQVAQIITYGTMAARSSIKDVARVLDFPLPESNELAKLVPERPGVVLERIINAKIDGPGGLKDKEGLQSDDLENVRKLREIAGSKGLKADVIREALRLEGGVRNTGVHAAGIIIAPMELTDIIPVAVSKESDLLVTQYEGKIIEDAGVIKMDFLGLRTLTIIKTALVLIKQNHGIDINIDEIPLDDQKTLELYQRAETNGTFQFESDGMQKYLRDLKPDKFEDLVAMNALYRPGPMEYIPLFIRRKLGEEPIAYEIPEMEEYLADTYGVTVYQEQVMLLSQKLAGFSKGDADVLRKAMGKKQIEVLNKMKQQFMDGTSAKGYDKKVCEKIWTDWEAFAQYAFNKSHSVCYAYVAFQTGYLKAHYPSEYMSAVLTHNQNNMDKVSFFMEECKRMGIPVLGPDVNESELTFAVNKNGQIRFGMSAIKGVGEGAADAIIEERKKSGPYKSVFDLTKRVSLRNVTKRVLEPLVKSGAFDSFPNSHRAQYFFPEDNEREPNTLEKALRYGANAQANESAAQVSMFGNSDGPALDEPQLPRCEPWLKLEELRKEKEVIGMFISGHPLDDFKFEIKYFCNADLKKLKKLKSLMEEQLFKPDETVNNTEEGEKEIEEFNQIKKLKNSEVIFAGIVTNVVQKIDKKNRPYGNIFIEDFDDAYSFMLFSDDFLRFEKYLKTNNFLLFRGKMQSRWNNSAEFEFKIVQIEVLGEVRDKMLKTLCLQLDLSQVDEHLTAGIEEVVSAHIGNCELKLQFTDPRENLVLDLVSKKYRINGSDEFFEGLRKIGIEQFKING